MPAPYRKLRAEFLPLRSQILEGKPHSIFAQAWPANVGAKYLAFFRAKIFARFAKNSVALVSDSVAGMLSGEGVLWAYHHISDEPYDQK